MDKVMLRNVMYGGVLDRRRQGRASGGFVWTGAPAESRTTLTHLPQTRVSKKSELVIWRCSLCKALTTWPVAARQRPASKCLWSILVM